VTICQRVRRHWDNAVSWWMDFEDRYPQRVASLSVAMALAHGVLVVTLILYLTWRIA